jgi:hypothetical protein
MKLLRILAVALITVGLADAITIYRKAHSAAYTTATMTTAEGAQINEKIGAEKYGNALQGNFLIVAPSGKYMLASNIREWTLVQIVILALALLSLIISYHRAGCSKGKSNETQENS